MVSLTGCLLKMVMSDCSELLADPNDVEEGLISNRYFNPYQLSGRYNTGEFICPDTKSLYLQGNFGTDEFAYV